MREIGCSNFSADELRAAEKATGPGAARFVSVQNEYSLLQREPEREVLDECRRAGLAFIPYYPLASGLLTGKYRQGRPAPAGSRLQSQFRQGALHGGQSSPGGVLAAGLPRRGDAALVELAVSWLASRPAVASVITGATSAEQVQANVAAAGWKLTGTELAEVDAILSKSSQGPD